MITLVDYGAGNLKSVRNALEHLGQKCRASSEPEEILDADRLVFPGVGSFGFMMASLRKKGSDAAIRDYISSGRPFLGICLGLQALFEESEESIGVSGLGIFKGKSVRFTAGKVPQIGWNKITPVKNGLFREGYAYFVNSYYVVPEDGSIIAAKTDYSLEFASAIQYRNITAVQFHPEKSGEFGIRILERWLKC